MKYFLLSAVALLVIGFTSGYSWPIGSKFYRRAIYLEHSVSSPTTLAFGPDNRLYVTQVDGTIFAYTIQKNGPNNYSVTNTETINLVKNIPNHNDRGAVVNLGNSASGHGDCRYRDGGESGIIHLLQ